MKSELSTATIRRIIILFICVIGLKGNLFGQGKVINLWNGKVPGAIQNKDYRQTIDSLDNWIKMRFVTAPTLQMFPAPAEKATGTAVIICPGGSYWGLAI